MAQTELLFQPNFSGLGPTINFVSTGSLMDESTVYVQDLTTSEIIFGIDGGSYFAGHEQFTYADWDPDHLYKLVLDNNLQHILPPENGGIGFREITTDIPFANVPEPSSLALLVVSAIGSGVVFARRKR